jgi:Mg2+ and Co2+ transporter CorA
VIARLFRAGEHEQQIDDPADLPREPRRHELLWVDVERGDESLEAGLAALGLEPAADRIRGDGSTPGVVRIEDVVHVTVLGLRQTEGDELPRPSRVEVLARGNAVLTLREEQVAGLGDLLELVEGRSELGSLDAATFTALLIEGLVQAFVRELADLRRRIAILRRTLAPNRSVVAALARPELGLTPGGPDPWPALLERLERAIDELENARELLLGSFDLVMTRTAQRTNDVVRVLTVVSVTLLPAGVLAGIFGMNFPSPVFESGGLFVWAVAFIALVSTVILLVALWRRWL